MNNWTFFASLTTQLMGIIQAATAGILNGALGWVRPIVALAAVGWIAFRAITVANGTGTLRVMWHDIIRIAVIMFLLQVANYNQYISAVAQAIPNEVGNALAVGGANMGDVASGAVFDTVWGTAAKAGLIVWEKIPAYSLASIPLWFVIIVYWGIALVSIGLSYIVYLASTVLLQLLIAVGGVFLALFAFEPTAKFAVGWVAAVASAIVTQILAMALLVMFVGVEKVAINQIIAGVAGGIGANFIASIFVLAVAALLMWLISILVKQTPSIAQAIAGGVYHNMSRVIGGTTSAAVTGAKMAVGGIALGGRGVSAGTRSAASRMTGAPRVTKPTGKSLS